MPPKELSPKVIVVADTGDAFRADVLVEGLRAEAAARGWGERLRVLAGRPASVAGDGGASGDFEAADLIVVVGKAEAALMIETPEAEGKMVLALSETLPEEEPWTELLDDPSTPPPAFAEAVSAAMPFLLRKLVAGPAYRAFRPR